MMPVPTARKRFAEEDAPFSRGGDVPLLMDEFARSSPNAIWIADPQSGRIVFLNPAGREFWERSLPQRTLADWEASVHEDDRDQARANRDLIVSGFSRSHQYRIVDRRGHVVRHLRETCFAMPQADGSQRFGGITVDITPRVRVYAVQIEPDEESRHAIERALDSAALLTFASAAELFNAAEALLPGCVLLDLRGTREIVPNATVIELLKARSDDLQLILIGAPDTLPGDVVAALRAGASDYLIAPFADRTLVEAIRKACVRIARTASAGSDRLASLLAGLTQREQEVLEGLVEGGSNKSIARMLELSPRTVENHRAQLMRRLQVNSLGELLHLAHLAGMRPHP